GGVGDGAGDRAVGRPGAQVEVLGAGGEPDVVDDADLGVHVDRHPVGVLEVDGEDPVGGRLAQDVEGSPLAEPGGRPVDPAVRVRVAGQDGDDPQLRRPAQRLGDAGRDLPVPQVLVLDVDE